jgi:hypothetical protein
MRYEGQVACEGSMHTIAYDTSLILVDHDLDRDLVFDALRYGPSEGCLAVRQAWLGVALEETGHDFLEAMLTEDEDVRGRMRRQLAASIMFAPQIEAAIVDAQGDGAPPRTPVATLAQWQLILLRLPARLALGYCRSLRPDLYHVDDDELRIELIGPERDADVLPFRGRA